MILSKLWEGTGGQTFIASDIPGSSSNLYSVSGSKAHSLDSTAFFSDILNDPVQLRAQKCQTAPNSYLSLFVISLNTLIADSDKRSRD